METVRSEQGLRNYHVNSREQGCVEKIVSQKEGRPNAVCYETGGLKRAMFGISGHRFLRFWFWYERMRWLGHQRCSQASTRHVQHTFQVVDHLRQADLGLRSF